MLIFKSKQKLNDERIQFNNEKNEFNDEKKKLKIEKEELLKEKKSILLEKTKIKKEKEELFKIKKKMKNYFYRKKKNLKIKNLKIPKILKNFDKNDTIKNEIKNLILKKKKYNYIVIDCPWDFDQEKQIDKLSGTSSNHYDCLTDQELSELKINLICEKDPLIFFWCVASKIESSFYIVKNWSEDFEFHSIFLVWIKTQKNSKNTITGLGSLARNVVEFVLLFKKKNSSIKKYLIPDNKIFKNLVQEDEEIIEKFNLKMVQETKIEKLKEIEKNIIENIKKLLDLNNELNKLIKEKYEEFNKCLILSEEVGLHSAKPEKFYQIIEKNFFNCKKIDIFGRKNRNLWDVIGNESQKNTTNLEIDLIQQHNSKIMSNITNYKESLSLKVEQNSKITENINSKKIIFSKKKKIKQHEEYQTVLSQFFEKKIKEDDEDYNFFCNINFDN